MAANQVAESEEESEDAALGPAGHHREVAEQHRHQEVEIRGESEREVREEGAGAGGVGVLGEPPGDEPPEEGDWDGGEVAEEEAKHGDGDADGGGHGFHLELHGGGRRAAAVRRRRGQIGRAHV